MSSAPAVIDSLEFARTGQRLEGSLPVTSLSRLDEVLAERDGDIAYEVAGTTDERGRPLLRVRLRGALVLQCQRCLGRLEYSLDGESDMLVVAQGTVPDDADDPEGPDYIEAQRELNVAELIEDEILLQLPFAPRHEGDCAGSVPADSRGEAKAKPFAALAALKKARKPSTQE